MKKLYVFGNEYLFFDSLAKKVASKLGDEVKIINCNSPDVLIESEDDEITILDVVKNIRKTTLIRDINKLKVNKLISVHDFDLSFFIKLMEKIGVNKRFKIIGIPQKGDIEEVASEVRSCILKI